MGTALRQFPPSLDPIGTYIVFAAPRALRMELNGGPVTIDDMGSLAVPNANARLHYQVESELELPFAQMGFATDYANEVVPGEPTPVATLIELMGRSTQIFADILGAALPTLQGAVAAGTVYCFGR